MELQMELLECMEAPMILNHKVNREHDFGNYNVISWINGTNNNRIALYKEGSSFRVGVFGEDNGLRMSTPCDSYEDAQALLLVREKTIKLRKAENGQSSGINQGS